MFKVVVWAVPPPKSSVAPEAALKVAAASSVTLAVITSVPVVLVSRILKLAVMGLVEPDPTWIVSVAVSVTVYPPPWNVIESNVVPPLAVVKLLFVRNEATPVAGNTRSSPADGVIVVLPPGVVAQLFASFQLTSVATLLPVQ